MTLGMKLTLVLGPRRFLDALASPVVVYWSPLEGRSSGVTERGVAVADVSCPPSSSSSSPKDSLPLATFFRFFLAGWGVDALYFDH